MEPAAVGRLCLPRARALGDRSSAAADPQFRHGTGLPIPDCAGHPRQLMDQIDPECTGGLALSAAHVRSALGTRPVEEAGPSRGSARDWNLKTMRASNAPLVSIILPTFDRLRFLRPAVDSVLAQSFIDWELLI